MTGTAPPDVTPQAEPEQPKYSLRAVMRGARIGVYGSSADNKIERDSGSAIRRTSRRRRWRPPPGDPPELAVGNLIDTVPSGRPLPEQAAALLDATARLRALAAHPAGKLEMLAQMRDRGDLSQDEFEAVLDS